MTPVAPAASARRSETPSSEEQGFWHSHRDHWTCEAERYADQETLGLLAQSSKHGAAFWAQNPKQLATIIGSVHSYLSDTKDTLQATFRIEASEAGAFKSGRNVLGIVQLEVCPWLFEYTDIPFVVQIP